MRLIYSLLIFLCCLPSCSSDSKEEEKDAPLSLNVSLPVNSEATNLPIPDHRFSNNYQVLIFGNSHVSGLASLIEKLIQTGSPLAKINILNASGGFLDSTSTLQRRTDLLENKQWTHIILQGQKYSQSGNTSYPTTSAQSWIKKAKQLSVTPILFPEHPQRGNALEGARVHQIHTTIATKQDSCVAPVGLAWDKVLNTAPQLILHAADGNHAALRGKLLTAYVFYEVITGESADLLPDIKGIDVEESTQQLLKQLASETILANAPCDYAI